VLKQDLIMAPEEERQMKQVIAKHSRKGQRRSNGKMNID
jgi:hypothetical protein